MVAIAGVAATVMGDGAAIMESGCLMPNIGLWAYPKAK